MPSIQDDSTDVDDTTVPNDENDDMDEVAPRFSPVSTAKSLQESSEILGLPVQCARLLITPGNL